MSDDEVRALYDAIITGWNDHDGAAMAASFADDGVVIGFDGSLNAGRETIGTAMARIFADHETGRYAAKVRSIRAVGSDAMILQAIAGLVPPGKTTIANDWAPRWSSSSSRSTGRPSITATRSPCCAISGPSVPGDTGPNGD
jgi:uncharacterized protein (TIGR02246 family)